MMNLNFLLKIVVKCGDVHTVKFIGVKNVLRSYNPDKILFVLTFAIHGFI